MAFETAGKSIISFYLNNIRELAQVQIVAFVHHLAALKYCMLHQNSIASTLSVSFRECRVVSAFILWVTHKIVIFHIISYAEQLAPIFTSICQLSHAQL